MWYAEKKDAVQSDIDKCCTAASGKVIGHFTQIVADRATKVGCAVSRYTKTNKESLVACNYAFTNMFDQAVFKKGVAAAGCTTGVNPDLPGLCSVDEPIKPKP